MWPFSSWPASPSSPVPVRTPGCAGKTLPAQLCALELRLGHRGGVATFRQPFDLLAETNAIASRSGRNGRGKTRKARFGWGGRIRTYGTRDQNPLPYHLATPQRFIWPIVYRNGTIDTPNPNRCQSLKMEFEGTDFRLLVEERGGCFDQSLQVLPPGLAFTDDNQIGGVG